MAPPSTILTHTSEGATSPPVIDISSFYASYHDPNFSFDKILRTAALIDHVLQKYGVFVAVGHNLTSNLLDANQKAMHELFQLSKHDKEAVSLKSTKAFGRGYLGFGEESGLLTEYFEPKEGFSYGYPDNHADEPPNLLQSRNYWPDGLSEESRNTLEEVYKQKASVAKLILFGLSKYFNMRSSFPNNYLEDITNLGHEISLMRLFHYFNVNDPKVQVKLSELDASIAASSNPETQKETRKGLEILGSSPHTDWGLLTLILQDNVGGLQFLHEGQWTAVTPTPGGIVVNGGDYLRMITNYRYQSPIHRVLSPNNTDVTGTTTDDVASSADASPCSSDGGDDGAEGQRVCQEASSLQERYSMVFFYYPNYDATLDSDAGKNYQFRDHSNSGVGAAKSVKTGGEGLNYNTLEFTGSVKESERFDSASSSVSMDGNTVAEIKSSGSGVMFGDYIIKKWRGVSRS